MKTKMVIKLNAIYPYETAQRIKENLLKQWHNDEAVIYPADVEIQAIILEDEKGEIKVINLKEERAKTRKNILEKIKKLFKKKNSDKSHIE